MTAGFVTEGRARQWGVNLRRWQSDLLRASLVDPETIARSGARLAKALARGRRVRITHPNGTDLEMALLGARPRVQDGRPQRWTKGMSPSGMLTNIPAGFVDVVLDDRSAEGSFCANRRTNIWWNWHAGGKLEFSGGKMVSHSLEDGAEQFERQFRDGSEGRDRASALSLGLNPAVRNVPNLEKWEQGCVSLQVGGNRGLGGSNHSSFFSWFCLAGAELSVDGTPVVRSGKVL